MKLWNKMFNSRSSENIRKDMYKNKTNLLIYSGLLLTIVVLILYPPRCSESIFSKVSISSSSELVLQNVILKEISGLGQGRIQGKEIEFGKFSVKDSDVPGLAYGYQEIIIVKGNGRRHVFQPAYIYDDEKDSRVMLGLFSGFNKKIDQNIPKSYNLVKIEGDEEDLKIIDKVRNWSLIKNGDQKKRIIMVTDPDCPFCQKQRGEIESLVHKSFADDLDIQIEVLYAPLDKIHPNARLKSRVLLGVSNELRVKAETILGYSKGGSEEDMVAMLLKYNIPHVKLKKKVLDERIREGEMLMKFLKENGTPILILPEQRLVLRGYTDMVRLIDGVNNKLSFD